MKNKIKNLIFIIRKNIVLALNKIRIHNKIQIINRKISIVINKKYRHFVILAKYLLIGIGLFSAFIIFKDVFIAFGFGLLIFILSSIIEKIAFTYSKEYFHNFNPSVLDNARWLAVSFGYVQNPNTYEEIPLVSMVCADNEYANVLHDQLFEWSDKKYNDRDCNLSISTIKNNGYYRFFCYPNPLSKKILELQDEEITRLRKKSLEDEFILLQGSLLLEKKCEITCTSYFPIFYKRYREDVPVLFEINYFNEKNKLIRASQQKEYFCIYSLKMKDKSELNRKDYEYDIMNYLRWD